jgi:hypothetical protein
VYEWFKDNYPNIKDIDEADKANYKNDIQKQKEQESREN